MGVDVAITVVNWFNTASSRASDAASRCSSPDLNPAMVPDNVGELVVGVAQALLQTGHGGLEVGLALSEPIIDSRGLRRELVHAGRLTLQHRLDAGKHARKFCFSNAPHCSATTRERQRGFSRSGLLQNEQARVQARE